jgi:hypothetical protein
MNHEHAERQEGADCRSNAGPPEERRLEFRIGIHLGDMVEEADGDLMGDGVNMFAGWAKFCLGRDTEAVAWLSRSIDANRNNPMSHFVLAAALAHLGQLHEAQSAAPAGLAINSAFTIGRMRAGPSTDNPAANAGGERLIDGLRKAGVPDEKPVCERNPSPPTRPRAPA